MINDPFRHGREGTDRQTSLRSDEHSTSPESVFQIPGTAVPLHRNTHVAGGQVVEHQGVLSKMPLGEPLLDGGLPLDQPVHRLIQLMGVDVAEPVQLAQGGYRALGAQRAGGGQF